MGGIFTREIASFRLSCGMNREHLITHLEQAERHVAQGEEHIVRQIELIARLEAGGHDTTEAKRLLGEFQELMAVHIAGRDRLRDQLASSQKSG
jgi:hypothetical protein